MSVRFSNNAKTTVTGLSTDRKLVTVQDASTFPDITGVGDYMYVTFASGVNTELIKATGIVFSTGTIQLDTALGSTLDVGSFVELRMTSELLSDLITLHSHDLSGIDDISLSTPGLGQVLTYNGAAWTNSESSGGGGAGSAPGVLDGGSALSTYGENAEGGSGQGVTVYANATELAAATLVTGALAYVTGIDKLLLCTGTAWSTLAVSNSPPTVSFSTTAVDEITDVTYNPSWLGYSDVTVNATDPDGVIPVVTVESNTMTSGTVVIQPGGSIIRVTPAQGTTYTGDSFVVRVTDGVNVVLQTITVDYILAPNIVGQQNFFSTAAFTVPDGVYAISYMLLAGGGGAGGSSNTYAGSYYHDFDGGNGGNGGRKFGTMTVTPSSVLTVTVGQGGAGSTMSNEQVGPAGNPGGNSTITGGLIAVGGGGAYEKYPIHNNTGGFYGHGSDGAAGSGHTWYGSQITHWTSNSKGDAGLRVTPYSPPSGGSTNFTTGGSGIGGAVRLIWGLKDGIQREFNSTSGYGTEDL